MKKKFFTILAVMLMTLTANAQHEYVDLGLPSGTLWATCNIGADSPEEGGDEFAWGETTTKNSYTQENYSFYGNPEVLDAEYDAAAVNWGSEWRMPSEEQCEELECGEYTTCEAMGEVIKITGKNGNSIILPSGDYWSSSIYKIDTNFANMMNICPEDEYYIISTWGNWRYIEGYVRPVRAQGPKYTISNIPDGWKVNSSTTNGTYESEEGRQIIFTPANIPAGKKIKSIKAVKQ